MELEAFHYADIYYLEICFETTWYTDTSTVTVMTWLNPFPAAGESTLTDAMTAAGKTYEEIAQLVAEQVGYMTVAAHLNITEVFAALHFCFLFSSAVTFYFREWFIIHIMCSLYQ